jgi:hypothetical protein
MSSAFWCAYTGGTLRKIHHAPVLCGAFAVPTVRGVASESPASVLHAGFNGWAGIRLDLKQFNRRRSSRSPRSTDIAPLKCC